MHSVQYKVMFLLMQLLSCTRCVLFSIVRQPSD